MAQAVRYLWWARTDQLDRPTRLAASEPTYEILDKSSKLLSSNLSAFAFNFALEGREVR